MHLPLSLSSCSKECGHCGINTAWVLHNLCLQGRYRRMCTSCVLRLHQESFCPSCFIFYDSQPPHLSKRCSSCSSFIYFHCVKSFPIYHSSNYLCNVCADSNFSFFEHRTDGLIDTRLALSFLCASRIAMVSMSKAVIVAKNSADKHVKEAVLAKKIARNALEHIVELEAEMNREKESQLLLQQQQSIKPSNAPPTDLQNKATYH